MTEIVKMFLACIIAVMFVAAPLAALARPGDGGPKAVICKSGKQVNNIKKCKEWRQAVSRRKCLIKTPDRILERPSRGGLSFLRSQKKT